MVGLFKKKTAREGSSKRKLKDFEEEEELEAEQEEAVEEEQEEEGGEVSEVKQMSELLGRLEEIEDKLGRLDSALTMMRNETTQVKDRMNQMDQDMRKLLSVYEVVSAKFNPFIEVSDKGAQAGPQAKPEEENVLELPPIELGPEVPEFKPFSEGEDDVLSFASDKTVAQSSGPAPWEPGTSTVAVGRGDQKVRERAQQLGMGARELAAQEKLVRASARSKHNKKPLLTYISHDYLTLTLVMRWIEFLFERTTRDKMSLVLDYYVDVGWISEDVKSEIMSYARGEMQDVTKYMAPEETREEMLREIQAPQAAPYKKVEDWRLSADDHLKSLLFIQKIAGLEVDKDRLNSLEQNIAKFKESLEGFHGV